MLVAALAGMGLVIFLLVFLAIPQRRVSKRRLGIEPKPRSVSDIGKRTTGAVDDLLERYGKRTTLATDLALAGVRQPPGEFVSLVLLAVFVVGMIGLLLGG